MSSKRPVRARPSYTNLFVPAEDGSTSGSSSEADDDAAASAKSDAAPDEQEAGDAPALPPSSARRKVIPGGRKDKTSTPTGKRTPAATKKRRVPVEDSSDESAFDPDEDSDAEEDDDDGSSGSDAVEPTDDEDNGRNPDSDVSGSIVGSEDDEEDEGSPGAPRRRTKSHLVPNRITKGAGSRPSTQSRTGRAGMDDPSSLGHSTLGAALAAADASGKKGTRVVPWDRNLTHNEQMQPVWELYTSCLLEPAGIARRSVIQRRGTPDELVLGEMRRKSLAKRVRTMTKDAYGMTPWEAWGGERWQPRGVGASSVGKGKGKEKEAGWRGIEGDWQSLRILSQESVLLARTWPLICALTQSAFARQGSDASPSHRCIRSALLPSRRQVRRGLRAEAVFTSSIFFYITE